LRGQFFGGAFEFTVRQAGVFLLLTGVGLSRCLIDIALYPLNVEWGIWLAPHPHVFVDSHYLLRKKLVVEMSDGQNLTFTLDSEEQWPLSSSLLFLNYTLVHCLDRPHRIDGRIWRPVVEHYFCRPESATNVLKPSLQASPIRRVGSYVEFNGKFVRVRELTCSK